MFMFIRVFIRQKKALVKRQVHLSLDIVQNSDGGISDFRISGQSLIKENCHNSRTCEDIESKLGPVTNFWQEKQNDVKKIDDDVMLAYCDVIDIFVPIWNNPEAGFRTHSL